MKKNSLTILTLMLITGTAFAGTYSSGSGTSGDPYQISTTAALPGILGIS